MPYDREGDIWNTIVKGMQEAGGEKSRYGYLLSELKIYTTPLKTSGFVIADRIGAGTTFGEPAFFQRISLGGRQSLPGFHTNRFGGQTMLYNDLEMRIKLFDFHSYVHSGAVGLIVFNDIGRVWMPDEPSSKWHDGYATGIYIIPAELLVIQGLFGFSKEGLLPYISVGFRF